MYNVDNHIRQSFSLLYRSGDLSWIGPDPGHPSIKGSLWFQVDLEEPKTLFLRDFDVILFIHGATALSHGNCQAARGGPNGGCGPHFKTRIVV